MKDSLHEAVVATRREAVEILVESAVGRCRRLLAGCLLALLAMISPGQLRAIEPAQLAEMGMKHYQQGSYAAAETAYRQVLALQPNNAHAWFMVGACKLSMSQTTAAVPPLERAVQLEPSEFAYWNALGSAYQMVGRHAEAKSATQRALQLNPNFPHLHYNLGQINDSLGDKNGALQELRILKETSPELAGQLEGYLVSRDPSYRMPTDLIENPVREDFTEPQQDDRQVSLLGIGAQTGAEPEEQWGNEQKSQFESIHNAGVDAWTAALKNWWAGEFGASKRLTYQAKSYFDRAGEMYGPAGHKRVSFSDPPPPESDRQLDMNRHGPNRFALPRYSNEPEALQYIREHGKSYMTHWGQKNCCPGCQPCH